MYVNVCRGVFATQQIIYGGAFLRKSQKNFIVDVPLVSAKYASGISFMEEKVCHSSQRVFIPRPFQIIPPL